MSDTDRIRAAIRSDQELAMTDAAFEGLRLAMINELIGSDYNEGASREHLYHGLRALDDVRNALKEMVKRGNDAKAMQQAAAEIAKAMKP